MTDPSHNAHPAASARIRAGGELSVTTHSMRETELRDSDQDALQVLLQASAAAEGLQRRFSELQRLQANLVSERNQLGADRTAFESRAREFADQVARDRTMQREVTAELDQRQQQLRHLQAELEQQRELLEENREELDAKRQRLHEAVNAELAREREAMQRQRDAIEAERQKLLERSEQLENQHAERLSKISHDIEVER